MAASPGPTQDSWPACRRDRELAPIAPRRPPRSGGTPGPAPPVESAPVARMSRRTPEEAMSAPNKTYDPVEVSALSDDAVAAAQAAALAAIAAAADLDALKAVRLEHAGDRSPLALANREIGALPPAAKAEAGKRVGMARAAVKKALEEREVVLAAERDERVLVEEAVDVTLARRPPSAWRPAPADHVDGAGRGRVRRDGLRGRRGPRGRGRVVQLRRTEHRPGPPRAHHAGHLLRRLAETVASSCARTPRRCRPAPC